MIIKDNRIVSDHTFAWRFVKFLEKVEVNDAAGEEELEYMTNIAYCLFFHQEQTATDSNEIQYLNSMVKASDFQKFLKTGKFEPDQKK